MTYQSLIPKVAAAFGVHYVAVGPLQKGYRNESYKLTLDSGENINLIFHKNERQALQRIQSADAASAILSNAFLPVRTRFDQRTLKVSDGKNDVYAGLYAYLPGKTIPWEAYTKDHIKLLGWAMSDMHATWRDASAVHSAHLLTELEGLLGRMDRYFKDEGVREALRRKLSLSVDSSSLPRFMRLVQYVARYADSQPLHMDLVRGNILFAPATPGDRWQLDGVALSGVIDFEKTALGSPLFDIARTAAFLLVDCSSKEPADVVKYFLRSGYNRRGGAHYDPAAILGSQPQSQLLPGLICLFLLHDFYKFLLHTPYESLPDNHHFVRTRDILVRNNMVRYV